MTDSGNSGESSISDSYQLLGVGRESPHDGRLNKSPVLPAIVVVEGRRLSCDITPSQYH